VLTFIRTTEGAPLLGGRLQPVLARPLVPGVSAPDERLAAPIHREVEAQVMRVCSRLRLPERLQDLVARAAALGPKAANVGRARARVATRRANPRPRKRETSCRTSSERPHSSAPGAVRDPPISPPSPRRLRPGPPAPASPARRRGDRAVVPSTRRQRLRGHRLVDLVGVAPSVGEVQGLESASWRGGRPPASSSRPRSANVPTSAPHEHLSRHASSSFVRSRLGGVLLVMA